MRLNPVLAGMATYPFVRLDQAKAAAMARGVPVIDFGAGEPREETPAFIRRAVAEAVELEPVSGYPKAEGLPALRAAIATWCQTRFGAEVDPDTEVVPTLGSKEAIFHLAQVVGGAGARVAVTTPGYPVPARGAAFAGAEVLELRLEPERGWLPDLDAVDWQGVAVLWLNSPNNPTAATAPLEFYERAAGLARAHGFVLACDEAYSELWFAGDPPVSALQVADRSNVIVFNTLSKRSSMPGYRSGFAAAISSPWPPGATRTTSWRPARATPRSAPSCSRPCAAWGSSRRAATRASSCGCASRGARAPRRSRCGCSTISASSWRPARSSGPAARAMCAPRSCRPSRNAIARPSS
jgi:acetylornithine aminotransferase